MKTSYFTFGQSHRHELDGVIYDRDVVVKITDPLPREMMFFLFGRQWSFEYDQPPDMTLFPRGIIDLSSLQNRS